MDFVAKGQQAKDNPYRQTIFLPFVVEIIKAVNGTEKTETGQYKYKHVRHCVNITKKIKEVEDEEYRTYLNESGVSSWMPLRTFFENSWMKSFLSKNLESNFWKRIDSPFTMSSLWRVESPWFIRMSSIFVVIRTIFCKYNKNKWESVDC